MGGWKTDCNKYRILFLCKIYIRYLLQIFNYMYSANFFYVYTGIFTHNYVKQICTLMYIQNHWCVFLSLSEMFRNKAFGVLSHSYKPLCFDRHFWRHLWFSFMYLHKHTVFRWLNPILRLIWVCLHPTLHGSHTASSVSLQPTERVQ